LLSTDGLGPLNDMQRWVIGEIEKSTARLAELAQEMSELARLMEGGSRFVMDRVELGPLIADEIPTVPPASELEVSIRLVNHATAAAVNGDAVKLRKAFNSLLYSCRRELVTSFELCVAIERVAGPTSMLRVTIGGQDRIDELRRVPEAELAPLVEFRGGMGYKLSLARRVIEAHGGRTFSRTQAGPGGATAPSILGAVVLLPEA
jgi:signal transduction histidine kinase